jgi:hypothetical protein
VQQCKRQNNAGSAKQSHVKHHGNSDKEEVILCNGDCFMEEEAFDKDQRSENGSGAFSTGGALHPDTRTHSVKGKDNSSVQTETASKLA